MNQVYITNSSLNEVLFNMDKSKFEFNNKFNLDRFSSIFTIPEKKYLAFYAEILDNPERLLDLKERFIVNKKVDQYRFIAEKKSRTYHAQFDCKRLNAEFDNFQLPIEVLGNKAKAIKYRKFYKENIYKYDLDLKKDNELFQLHAGIACGIQIKNSLKKIDYKNSGVIDFNNISLEEIQNKTDDLIMKMDMYRYSNPEIEMVIKKLGYGSGRHIRDDKFFKDDPKHPLYLWHKYKLELLTLIRNLFRIKNNPELSFKKRILEQLDFRPCNACFSESQD